MLSDWQRIVEDWLYVFYAKWRSRECRGVQGRNWCLSYNHACDLKIPRKRSRKTHGKSRVFGDCCNRSPSVAPSFDTTIVRKDRKNIWIRMPWSFVATCFAERFPGCNGLRRGFHLDAREAYKGRRPMKACSITDFGFTRKTRMAVP
jgi:hypothetical protein